MKKVDHYENINRFIAKALAHGAESAKAERQIRKQATNMYVEAQIKLSLSKQKICKTQRKKQA